MPRIWWGSCFILICVMALGCGPDTECGEYPLSDQQRQCVVETIDGMVHESFPFADYKGVDLDEFSAKLEATLEADTDDQEFLADVRRAIAKLQDGHTRMERHYLEDEAPATAPVGVRDIDGDVVIDRVDDPEQAELIGERVDQIDGVKAAQQLREHQGITASVEHTEVALSGPRLALAGDPGSTLELTLEDGTAVTLQRRPMHDEPQTRVYDDNIGYLRVDTFGFIDDLERIDEAINELSDTDGLMIDLRDNGGGFPSVSEGLFSRLIQEERSPFRMVDVNDNVHRELPMEPRGDAYEGDITLLVNGTTYSASNLVAHRFRYHQRGALVGESTGGGAASPSNGAMILPGLWFQVSTHVVRAPDGEHRESGIEPDLEVDVEEEVAGVQEGAVGDEFESTGDPVIDRAILHLNGEE